MTEISQVVTPVRRRPNPPHRGPPGQKTDPPARSVSNPRRCCVQSCPIRWPAQSQQAISDLAYLLRPQVRGQSVPIRHHTTVNRWGLGGIAVQVLSAYDLHMLLLSVHPCPLLSFVTGPCQPGRPCAHNKKANRTQPDDRFRLAQHPDLRYPPQRPVWQCTKVAQPSRLRSLAP